MRNITKIRRNAKALSPIFATLILIAIAVIAGIVVYMFTSGTIANLTGSGGPGTEKMNIQAVSGTASNGAVIAYAQSTGGGSIPIDSVILKAANGTVLQVARTSTVPAAITGGPVAASLTTVTVTFSTTSNAMVAGETYSITIVSVAGGSFPSTSFKAS